MPLSPAQVAEAMRRAGMNRAPSRTDLANAGRYGLGIFAQTARRMGQPQQSPDITRDFVDQIRDLFTPATKPNVTPFDQSGFFNEADTKALADQEYDPYYARLRSEQQGEFDELGGQRRIQEAASDRDRLEQVNASGGYGSSAFKREMADQGTLRSGQDTLRQQALRRAFEEQDIQKRLAKEQFGTNRRGEAYNRYAQSIGTYAY